MTTSRPVLITIICLSLAVGACSGSDDSGDVDAAESRQTEETADTTAEPAETTAEPADTDGDGGAPVDADAVDVLASQLQDSGGAQLGVSDEQIDCIASNAVDRLGADRVLELAEADGFETDFVVPPDEARQVADAFFDCVSFSELLTDALDDAPGASLLPTEFVECLADNIDEDAARDGLAEEFTGESSDSTAFEELGEQAGLACLDVLTPEQLDDLAGG